MKYSFRVRIVRASRIVSPFASVAVPILLVKLVMLIRRKGDKILRISWISTVQQVVDVMHRPVLGRTVPPMNGT